MPLPDLGYLPYPKIGERVRVMKKIDYPTKKLTEGVVKEILTSQHGHPRGTKVRLATGEVGRIQEFVDRKIEKPVEAVMPQETEEKPVSAAYFNDPDALI